MAVGDDDRELTGGAAHVAERLVLGEVELLRQRLERAHGDPGHRVHELLEPVRVAVELLEHRLAGVLDLVLGLAGPQRLGEIAPESDTAARWPSRGSRRCRRGSPCRERRRSPACCGRRASLPSPSRSSSPRATSASGKSGIARACRPSASAICGPVIASPPSLVNSSSSTADRRVFDAQNPIPTCMMCDGSTCSGTMASLSEGDEPAR